MSIYYIYAYLRQDGTPYYIGKGKGRRAFASSHRVKVPPKERIIFLKNDLSEKNAFSEEIKFIKQYGRKDLGTGILQNRSDGGEGASGTVLSDKHKSKIRKAHLGKKMSIAARKAMSDGMKGRIPWNKGKKCPSISQSQIGKKMTTKHRRSISEAKRLQWETGVYANRNL